MTTITRIKVCGITSVPDARLAHGMGADYVGLVFVPGTPRCVGVDAARAVRDALPEATLVGVFADAPLDAVAGAVAAAGLDLVQLHGAEPPAYCDALHRRTHRPIIKAFARSPLPDTDALGAYRTSGFFLFDLAKPPAGPDALHRTWEAVARQGSKGFRLFVAGGLDPTNVREAVARARPYGVDVCRGVEHAPGIKDPRRLERFIAEVRG